MDQKILQDYVLMTCKELYAFRIIIQVKVQGVLHIFNSKFDDYKTEGITRNYVSTLSTLKKTNAALAEKSCLLLKNSRVTKEICTKN